MESLFDTLFIFYSLSWWTLQALIFTVFLTSTFFTNEVFVLNILNIFGVKSRALHMVPVWAPALILINALNPLGCRDIFTANAFFFVLNIYCPVSLSVFIRNPISFFWLLSNSIRGLFLEFVLLLKVIHYIPLQVEGIKESSLS